LRKLAVDFLELALGIAKFAREIRDGLLSRSRLVVRAGFLLQFDAVARLRRIAAATRWTEDQRAPARCRFAQKSGRCAGCIATAATAARTSPAGQNRCWRKNPARTTRATAAQQTITDLTREFRDAQRKLQEIDRQLAQRTARLRLLQQLQEKWEGFGEGAKAVLQGRLMPPSRVRRPRRSARGSR